MTGALESNQYTIQSQVFTSAAPSLKLKLSWKRRKLGNTWTEMRHSAHFGRW